MNQQIIVTVNGQLTHAAYGSPISRIISGEMLCGGHGKCGKCKVIARGCLSEPTDDERSLLSKQELDGGVRLACLTHALGDCEILTVRHEQKAQIIEAATLPEFPIKPAFEGYGIAIDIGTTTLAAQLYDTAGNLLGSTSRLNPQQAWGADVISRIEAALGGKARELALSVRQAVDDMIAELASAAGIDAQQVDGLVITGNTVMLSLLTEQSTEPFSHAPFEAERLFGETLTSQSLELTQLQKDVPVYLPPCISAFVGADTACAILATQLCRGDTAMLADIGTNGEMALWHNGKLIVCSTAAGPAFEGVGISMGMRGADGAIDKVHIVNGQIQAHVIGGGAPVGICGSGLVDAVACMLDLEIIDAGGYLDDEEFVLLAPVRLTQKDIRMLQLAKSAICAGLMTLAESEMISVADVPVLYVAGGFGNYLSKACAARIGLLPKALASRSRAVGNGALAGAAMLLLNRKLRQSASTLAKNATTLELSTSRVFADRYMSGMMLEQG